MKKRMIFTALLAVILVSASVQAGTIATFADPSKDPSMPLFTVDLNTDTMTGQINGGWTSTGLTLKDILNGVDYTDVQMVVPNAIAITSLDTTGAGTVQFFNGNDLLLQIDFQSATANFYVVGADNILNSNDVEFSGSIVAGVAANLTMESFSFALTNQTLDMTNLPDAIVTSTAAMTSSAVPEPTTIVLLGLGSLTLIGRRRRVK